MLSPNAFRFRQHSVLVDFLCGNMAVKSMSLQVRESQDMCIQSFFNFIGTIVGWAGLTTCNCSFQTPEWAVQGSRLTSSTSSTGVLN